jgi:hypothetical protein
VPGHTLSPALSRKVFDRLTALGRAAAHRYNEYRSNERPAADAASAGPEAAPR